MTPAETVLWDELRDRRFDGLKFRRQHAIGRFVVDFYCDALRLVVEVDGGIHRDPEQRQRDGERQKELEETGVSFVRFSNDDVLLGMPGTLARLRTLCSPSPAQSGEGVGG